MDESKNYKPKYAREEDPWEESSWQTGSTHPPKSRSGMIAVLLVLVIFLSGIVTVLGVLNVKLFQQLKAQEQEQDLAISYSAESLVILRSESLPYISQLYLLDFMVENYIP